MGSDYFIVPTSPDFFCYQAMQSLGKMLPDWAEDFKHLFKQKVQDGELTEDSSVSGKRDKLYNLDMN